MMVLYITVLGVFLIYVFCNEMTYSGSVKREAAFLADFDEFMSDTSIIIPILRRTLFSTASPSAVKKSGRYWKNFWDVWRAKTGYGCCRIFREGVINTYAFLLLW